MWAVEPSEQMRVYLEEDRGALPPDASARIRVVTGNWPEVQAEVPPVEVPLASLVIHFYADAAGFLEGMGRAATRRCVLAIRAGQMEPLAARLWPLFHPDRPAPAQPVLRDVLAVMEEVGLHPDVQTHAPARPYGRYPSREEARSRLAAMLRLESDADLARLDPSSETCPGGVVETPRALLLRPTLAGPQWQPWTGWATRGVAGRGRQPPRRGAFRPTG